MDNSLYNEIYETIMLLKQVLLRVHAGTEEDGLSRTQLGALGILSVTPSLPVSDLAKRLRISKPQASVLVRRLEELGLVERLSAGDDKRVCVLSLTAKGRATLNSNVRKIKAKMKEKLDALSETEQNELSESLGSIVRLLAKLE
jgi:DNA-binding MarR family transcriptional regulator